ncbi:MAG: hypothetical protein H6574_24225 [Lewinellaceae bacterium]|nr:hypothetical protein [Saprospiraceae bacterium]MCB9334168.1 hypothetical protein [Lewinellaceae bacterium]
METYLTHLLEDLHAITLARWRRCPPHFYQAGMRDDLHQPPEGFLEKPQPDALPGETEAAIGEIENWLHSKPAITMFDHFGLEAEQFPPAEKLTEAQAHPLVDALVRLWVAHNFLPTLPNKAPARIFYPMMLARMAEPAMLLEHGMNGIEFCDFDPEGCPFGEAWCDCKEYLSHDVPVRV